MSLISVLLPVALLDYYQCTIPFLLIIYTYIAQIFIIILCTNMHFVPSYLHICASATLSQIGMSGYFLCLRVQSLSRLSELVCLALEFFLKV